MTPPLISKVALLLLVAVASALQFTVQPTMIEIGLTPNLDLRCSFTHGIDTEIASLVSMFISRSSDIDNAGYQEIASVNSFSGNITNVAQGNATVSGFISNLNQSFIVMHWAFPGEREAGLYKCVANGVDGTGHPQSFMSTTQVSSELPNIRQLVVEIRNLKADISGFWHPRLELMKNARFEISSLYKGRRYLLSKLADFVSVPVALESCALYGGYLAEIDDDEEMQFVQNFIKHVTPLDFHFVLTGITDEGHERVWAYQRDGRAVAYTKWAPGQPNGGPEANCVYLWFSSGWLMADSFCFIIDRADASRYLCEVPVQEN